MPKSTITQETKLATRNSGTMVDAIVTITVDGRELPTLATLGGALEDGIHVIQKAITDSYVIPPRV